MNNRGRHVVGAAVCAVLLTLPLAASGEAGVSTTPSPLVLGEAETAELRIDGLAGAGPVHAAVNVGQIDRIAPTPGGAVLRYRLPEGRHPRRLGLLIWGDAPRAAPRLLRVPLHGQTLIPVKTRSRSQVRVIVGRRRYGPLNSGWRGRVAVEVVVAPDVTKARVEVVDRKGLVSEKSIPIETVAFNPLVMALLPTPGPSARVLVGSVRRGSDAPRAAVDGTPLRLRPLGPGLWHAACPLRRGSTIRVKAWYPDAPEQTVEQELEAPAAEAPAVASSEPAAAGGRGLVVVAGVAVGLLHNTGALISPRFAGEVGLDVRLPVGWLGLRALVGTSWASQEVEGTGGLEGGESSVLLLPVGGGLCYRLPLPAATPYALAAVQAQLVRARSRAPFLAKDEVSSEWGLALLGLVGAERQLGPGLVFLQAGFQWGSVDIPAVELLSGGVIIEGGYRFRL